MSGKKHTGQNKQMHAGDYKPGSQIEQAAWQSKPVRTFTEQAVVFAEQVGLPCYACHAHLEIDAAPMRKVRCPSCRKVIYPCKVCKHDDTCDGPRACRLNPDPVEAVEVRRR